MRRRRRENNKKLGGGGGKTTQRTCIITLRLSDFKSQKSLTLLLRHYELTNENVSYFLTNQSKTKTFVDLKVTRKPKPTKNRTRPYLNEIPAHFTYKIKGSLSKGVFERRTSTGSEVFSLLICLDDIKFVFLSFFTVIEAI